MYNFKLNIEIGYSTGPGKVSLKQQMVPAVNYDVYVHVCIYRVAGNWWYKRKGGDSTRKKKSKI